MSLGDSLSDLRAETLSAIGTAAFDGDSGAVRRSTARLAEIDELIRRYEELARDVERVQVPESQRDDEETFVMQILEPNARTVGRARAVSARREFIARAAEHGVELSPERGIFFSGPGGRVAITYASEIQPRRWWLALPEGQFDRAVLLCQTVTNDVVALCLDDDFFQNHGQTLSRKNGRIYFNVVKTGASFALSLPGVGTLNADAYRDRFINLT